MKKTISIVACVCLMACFATVSFATTDINAKFAPILTSKNDGNTYIGMLDALNFSASEKALYDEFMKAFTGENIDSNFQYFAFMRVDSNRPNDVVLMFERIPASVKIGTKLVSGIRKLTVSTNCSSQYILWSTEAGRNEDGSIKRSGINLNNSIPAGESILVWGSSYSVMPSNSGNLNLDSSMTSAIVEPLNPTFIGQLGYVDNLSNLEPNPDPPLPPVNPPKPPEIPKGDPAYVPYDTSIWNQFLSFVQGNIGSAVNVGLLIFAVIFGILFAIKVVKWFTKG